MTEPRDPFEDWLTRLPVEPLPAPRGVFDRIARSARRRRWAKAAGAGATALALATGLVAVIGALSGPDREADVGPTSTIGSPTPSRSQSAPPRSGGRCTAAQLQVSVAPGANAAGHIGLLVVFTNTSGQACTMSGHPGVSFVTGPSGLQVNDPAERVAAGTPPIVTLVPNGKAHANLLLVNVANYAGGNLCQPTQVSGVRVYPPDDTTALFASNPQQICTVKGTGLAQIYPVQAGSS